MSAEQRHATKHDDDDVDVVEMKKAIATGSAKEGPSVSSGEFSRQLRHAALQRGELCSTSDCMLLPCVHPHDCCKQSVSVPPCVSGVMLTVFSMSFRAANLT